MTKETETMVLEPIDFSDGSVTTPEEFLLIRYGESEYTKGEKRETFSFSEADADEIVADFSRRGKDVVIDYEHQTLSGAEAPASGWINTLKKTPEGLSVKASWTDRAKERLHDREYRYHSPVLHFKAGRPYRLHSVALTNHPALHGMPALVADDSDSKHPNIKEGTMNEHLKKIATLLSVNVIALADGNEDEKATVEAMSARVTELLAGGATLSELLKLHDCASVEALNMRIAGMVPAAQKAELEAKLAKIEAEKAVSLALTDGKIVEAQKAWATAYAVKDLTAFNDFVAAAPKSAPGPASVIVAGQVFPVAKSFSDVELAVFKKLSLSDEQITKMKKED